MRQHLIQSPSDGNQGLRNLGWICIHADITQLTYRSVSVRFLAPPRHKDLSAVYCIPISLLWLRRTNCHLHN